MLNVNENNVPLQKIEELIFKEKGIRITASPLGRKKTKHTQTYYQKQNLRLVLNLEQFRTPISSCPSTVNSKSYFN